MPKSADAFRTISEVADWLETPAHVLRFWESKFSQVKPVKRAGGRRYYRPADMKLLGGIKKLLHDDGMTIKGVQKVLRDQGAAHVSDMSQPLGDAADDVPIDHDDATAPVTGLTVPRPETPTDPVTVSDAPSPAQPEPDPAAPVLTQPPEPDPAPQAELVFPETTPPPRPSFRDGSEQEQDAPTTPPLAVDMQPSEPALQDDTQGNQNTRSPLIPEPVLNPPIIAVPDDPTDDIASDPGILSRLASLPRPLTVAQAAPLKALLERLRPSDRAGQETGT
ncbi:MAG: MerR family transcriptional regulator [Rhodobacteraceae bacterium]|nr:MerR family transcriptional regulator [Paracoccaceae bacterium]